MAGHSECHSSSLGAPKDTLQFLLPRSLNSDPIENFLGAIRQQGGNNDNPTPVQFTHAFRKGIIGMQKKILLLLPLGSIIKVNTLCILKAHSQLHSMSGGSFIASLVCHCHF